jgi:benzoyl-CoA reductase/2-hydroxyglutaryl-CoA dehydratase subunit BcrC/BadD/HgdB
VTDLGKGLDSLADKFSNMDNCSVLYDAKKKRVDMIVEDAIKYGAEGVIVVLTKFCDPEEFDYPLIKRACEAASLPIILIEVDRQMGNFEQARTMVETFKAMLDDKK